MFNVLDARLFPLYVIPKLLFHFKFSIQFKNNIIQ